MKKLSTPFNFLGLEKKYASRDKARVLILPVPYEKTVSYGKGASRGPRAIINASRSVELYDEELCGEFHSLGIHTLPPFKPRRGESPDNFIPRFEKYIEGLLKRKAYIGTLGGEHSITAAVVKAYKKKYPDLSVLQLDAHADLRTRYEGTAFSHACVTARLVNICPVVQVGVRSLSLEESKVIKKRRIPVFWACEIKTSRSPVWMRQVVSNLSSNVYISVDVDVFDPSIMLSTGTPEPGGLLWEDVTTLLRQVCLRRRVVGFDMVELAPVKSTHAPDFMTARLAYKLISYSFSKFKVK